MYTAVVRPAMTYAASLWHRSKGDRQPIRSLTKKLATPQNNCLKVKIWGLDFGSGSGNLYGIYRYAPRFPHAEGSGAQESGTSAGENKRENQGTLSRLKGKNKNSTSHAYSE